jgi:hypothetical protein
MLLDNNSKLSKKNLEELAPQIARFKKMILNLSTGGIVLSFTYLQYAKHPYNLVYLKISWTLFLLNIIGILISEILNIRHSAQWQIFINFHERKNKKEETKYLKKYLKFLKIQNTIYYIIIFLIIIALILLFIFVLINS